MNRQPDTVQGDRRHAIRLVLVRYPRAARLRLVVDRWSPCVLRRPLWNRRPGPPALARRLPHLGALRGVEHPSSGRSRPHWVARAPLLTTPASTIAWARGRQPPASHSRLTAGSPSSVRTAATASTCSD